MTGIPLVFRCCLENWRTIRTLTYLPKCKILTLTRFQLLRIEESIIIRGSRMFHVWTKRNGCNKNNQETPRTKNVEIIVTKMCETNRIEIKKERASEVYKISTRFTTFANFSHQTYCEKLLVPEHVTSTKTDTRDSANHNAQIHDLIMNQWARALINQWLFFLGTLRTSIHAHTLTLSQTRLLR